MFANQTSALAARMDVGQAFCLSVHGASSPVFIYVNLRTTPSPISRVILLQNLPQILGPLNPCDCVDCMVFARRTPIAGIQKSHPISHCGSMTLEVNRGKWHEKYLEFFEGHFDKKSLENQAKTVKKNVKITQKTCSF
jgi:hypothetical protein